MDDASCTHHLSALLRIDTDGAPVCLVVTACPTHRSQQVLPGMVHRARARLAPPRPARRLSRS